MQAQIGASDNEVAGVLLLTLPNDHGNVIRFFSVIYIQTTIVYHISIPMPCNFSDYYLIVQKKIVQIMVTTFLNLASAFFCLNI